MTDFPATLDGMLKHLEQRAPQTRIELGLDRVRQVLDRQRLDFDDTRIVSVAGTNGKGSTVAFLEAIAGRAGLSALAFTSPHLVSFGERFRLRGAPLPDDDIASALHAVERARGEYRADLVRARDAGRFRTGLATQARLAHRGGRHGRTAGRGQCGRCRRRGHYLDRAGSPALSGPDAGRNCPGEVRYRAGRSSGDRGRKAAPGRHAGYPGSRRRPGQPGRSRFRLALAL